MSLTNPIAPRTGETAGATDERTKARLQTAVREFESLFVGYMLKSMRAGLDSDEMFGDSFGGDVLEGMFDMELAKQMSRQSSFGLGEMLYRKMTGENLPKGGPHPTSGIKAPVSGRVAPPVADPLQAPAADPLPPPENGIRIPGDDLQPYPEVRLPDPAETPVPPVAVRAQEVVPAKPRQSVAIPAAVPAHKPLATVPAPVSPRQAGGKVEERLGRYASIIQEAAECHGVKPELLKAVIASESGGVAEARSPRQAKGLMQLIDTTAADMGVKNVWDPRENIFGGAKYLQQLLQRFDGNVEHAVASYNAGPGAVEKHGGVPPFRETQSYVRKVMGYLRLFEQQGSSDHGED